MREILKWLPVPEDKMGEAKSLLSGLNGTGYIHRVKWGRDGRYQINFMGKDNTFLARSRKWKSEQTSIEVYNQIIHAIDPHSRKLIKNDNDSFFDNEDDWADILDEDDWDSVLEEENFDNW